MRIASSPSIVGLALRMSAVIGSVLNLINQGDALFGDAKLVFGKLLLTYLVPYCVATYSATTVSLRLTADRAP
ncbi:MAG TPA: nitrate/nitrite transporter NrtS [Polyangiales bacterium]